MRPFLLQDGYKDEVEFVKESSLCLKRFFGAGALDDEAYNEISNTCNHLVWGINLARSDTYLDTAPLVRLSI